MSGEAFCLILSFITKCSCHAVFLQEVWDYIGSSRMVYDMKNGDFPNCEVRVHYYRVLRVRLLNI
jgi:hypothetical protein